MAAAISSSNDTNAWPDESNVWLVPKVAAAMPPSDQRAAETEQNRQRERHRIGTG